MAKTPGQDMDIVCLIKAPIQSAVTKKTNNMELSEEDSAALGLLKLSNKEVLARFHPELQDCQVGKPNKQFVSFWCGFKRSNNNKLHPSDKENVKPDSLVSPPPGKEKKELDAQLKSEAMGHLATISKSLD